MEENDCPFQAWQPSPDLFDDDESTPEAEVTDISKEDSLGLPEEARNNPNWMREEGFLSPRSSEYDLDSERQAGSIYITQILDTQVNQNESKTATLNAYEVTLALTK